MRDIHQIIKAPPRQPTADEIIEAALATAQEAMEDLGLDATPLMRAEAIVALGHPCWFATQQNRNFFPISEGGGIAREGQVRTTVDLEKLARAHQGNTIIFEISLPNGAVFPCVYDRQFRRCGPFTLHIDAGR
jgi:hypothetical protein